MVKNYWNRILYVVFVTFICFLLTGVVKAESYSDLFIMITDAQTVLKQGDNDEALDKLTYFKEKFTSLEHSDSTKGKIVSQDVETIISSGTVTNDKLTQLSKDLLAFEKEQNPVDIESEKSQFKAKIYPQLEQLKTVIDAGDKDAISKTYNTFNNLWTRNESIVRTVSQAHYGKIETNLSFLHASIEAEPFSLINVKSSYEDLKQSIDNFMDGKDVTSSNDVTTLAQGISLLEDAYNAFTSGDSTTGQNKMKTFITNWTIFEGEVSTRSSSLYNKVEAETPVIMVKGSEKNYQKQLKELINELTEISETTSYSAIDAMSILLREGIEALLIVMTLVEILKAAKQKRGLKWVYAGAIVGMIASLLTAALLQVLFPAITSSSNREMLEGFVGIIAVLMMFGVGIWLHSMSNMKAWTSYMERQLKLVMSTGSFISMFALSFLAVFREGAETVLFYVGILPHISLNNFLLGISLAILLLFIIAIVLTKSTKKLPLHLIFKILTILIYILAFKMLGVSLHALQLTSTIPNHVFVTIPTIDFLGIYPSYEVAIAQSVFLLILIGIFTYRYIKDSKNG